MHYIRRHTSIPVPSIIEVFLDDGPKAGDSWILMERVPGLQLDVAWPQMTDAAQAATVQQLRSCVEQLHQLGSSISGKGWIGSASGGPAYDHRLSTLSTVGPFASVAAFHDFLVDPVRQCPRPDWAPKYRQQLPDQSRVFFSHADLSWENIIVDVPGGTVNGIIDWEMAGFWPEWWEYRKALFGSRSRQTWWVEIIKGLMREYPIETDTDMDLEVF